MNSLIKKLVVDNFQSHEHSEVRLGAGLNVIVGPSDFGKSALVRALRWLYYNEPRGANFIRVGARTCRVSVELDDGTRIARVRTIGGKNQSNQYLLQRPGEDQLVFEGFGSEVPREIVLATGVSPVQIDEHNRVELNFGQQLDGPFLLSENGAIRAKVIGQLGGVHIIDWAQRSTTTDLRRLREEEGRLAERLAVVETNLHAYDHLPKLAERITGVDQLLLNTECLEKELEALVELQTRWCELEVGLQQAYRVIERLAYIGQAETLLEQLTDLSSSHQIACQLAGEFSLVQKQLELAEQVVTRTTSLTASEDSLSGAEGLLKELEAMEQISTELNQVNTSLKRAGWIINRTGRLEDAEQLVVSSNAVDRQLADLDRVSLELSGVAVQLERVSQAIDQTELLEQADRQMSDAEQFVHQLADLGQVVAELEAVQETLLKVDDVDSRTAHLERVDTAVAGASESVIKLATLQTLENSWQEHRREYQGTTLAAERYQGELTRQMDEFRQILTKLGRCPVCFGELDQVAIERVLSEYE